MGIDVNELRKEMLKEPETLKSNKDKEKEEVKKQEVKKQEKKDIGYKNKLFLIENHYEQFVKELKEKYQEDIKDLDQYKPKIQKQKKEELKEVYSIKLDSIYNQRDKEIKKEYEKLIEELEGGETKGLDDISTKEMIYIDVILRTKDFTQISQLAERFINNEDVENMIRATVSNLDEVYQNSIDNLLRDRQIQINKLNEESRSVGTNSPLDKLTFFRGY